VNNLINIIRESLDEGRLKEGSKSVKRIDEKWNMLGGDALIGSSAIARIKSRT
jgi:hypothetical protein